MLLAAGLSLLLGQLAHLLLDITELALQPLVLLLLPVLSGRTLIPLLCQLLHVLLQPRGQALRSGGHGVTPDSPPGPLTLQQHPARAHTRTDPMPMNLQKELEEKTPCQGQGRGRTTAGALSNWKNRFNCV